MPIVHINFKDSDHKKLKAICSDIDIPMATYCKTLVLDHMGRGQGEKSTANVEPVYIRKPRIIRN